VIAHKLKGTRFKNLEERGKTMKKTTFTLVLVVCIMMIAGYAQAGSVSLMLEPGTIGPPPGVGDGALLWDPITATYIADPTPGRTEAFDQMAVYTQTTSTDYLDGTFKDQGSMNVTAFLVPPVDDDEGINRNWSIYGTWDDLQGTYVTTPVEVSPGVFQNVNTYTYTSGTMNIYASSGTPYNYGTKVYSDDSGFNSGTELIGTLSLVDGSGDLNLTTLSGSVLLNWEFTSMTDDFWLNEYGQDLFDFPFPKMAILDANTHNVTTDFDQDGNMLVYSNHNGSIDITVPEPASMVLFGSGLFGLVGAGIRKRKA